MRKKLEYILWLLNVWLACIPTVLVVLPLIISSLVTIIFSPLLAFFGANGCKLAYQTSESWWEIYKRNLIDLCTDLLPIVRWYKG